MAKKIGKINPKLRPRQFPDMCISCPNNGLVKHWLDLQKKLSFKYLKYGFVSCLTSVLETYEMSLRCLFKMCN